MTTTDDLRSERESRGTLSADSLFDRRSRMGAMSPEGYEQYELLHNRNAHGCYETQRINERETNMNSIDSRGIDIHIRRSKNNPGLCDRQRVRLHEVADADEELNSGEKVNEWHKVLDRLFFFMFLVFLVVPTTAMLGLVKLAKPEL